MSRDDSVLYSGMTSASFTPPAAQEVKKKQQDSKRTRLEKKKEVQPIAEPVMDLIQKYKDKVTHINEFAVETMVSDEHFKSEVMARKKFYQFLTTFETELKGIMKEHNL